MAEQECALLKETVENPHHLDQELGQELWSVDGTHYAIETGTGRTCNYGTDIDTADECQKAMDARGTIETFTNESSFETIESDLYPKKCYRETAYSDKWYFNTHDVGAPNAAAQSVCEGKAKQSCCSQMTDHVR